jgi:hypothetical protein
VQARRREPARSQLYKETPSPPQGGCERAERGAVDEGAPTDGSVILQTPASMLMIYPHIYKKLAYDAFPT